LARENEDLRRELATRLAQGAELDSVVRENQELRALNLIPPSAGFKSVGLEVVGRIQDEASTSYLVNRGSADGVRPGVAVVAGVIGDHNRTSALLVGTITQVASHTARFTLTTSSQSQVLAEVLNTAHSRGAAVGEYNLGLQLKFIPLADDVTVGQAVVTSNLDNLIPPGLLVGTVTNVEKHEGDFFLSATVAPPVNVDHFRFLEVLLPR
jgi:rod shape-determining protein MreC